MNSKLLNKLMTLNTKEKYQLYFLLNTKCLCYILSKILANLAFKHLPRDSQHYNEKLFYNIFLAVIEKNSKANQS